ncbi:hypothetical protein ACSSS7_006604 [Eimeria intestinalis]
MPNNLSSPFCLSAAIACASSSSPKPCAIVRPSACSACSLPHELQRKVSEKEALQSRSKQLQQQLEDVLKEAAAARAEAAAAAAASAISEAQQQTTGQELQVLRSEVQRLHHQRHQDEQRNGQVVHELQQQ